MSVVLKPSSTFRPKKQEASPSFYVTVYSSIEKAIAFAKQTNSVERAEDFLIKNKGNDFFYRKQFTIALCRIPKIPVAMMDAALYNAPLIKRSNMNIETLIGDDENDRARAYENDFLRSISDENGHLDSNIVNTELPFLYIRGISVVPKFRKQGFGGYLFENFGDYLKGMYGVSYDSVFAPGYTFVVNEDFKSVENFDKFIHEQKKIIKNWLRRGNFRSYKDNEERFFKKFLF